MQLFMPLLLLLLNGLSISVVKAQPIACKLECEDRFFGMRQWSVASGYVNICRGEPPSGVTVICTPFPNFLIYMLGFECVEPCDPPTQNITVAPFIPFDAFVEPQDVPPLPSSSTVEKEIEIVQDGSSSSFRLFPSLLNDEERQALVQSADNVLAEVIEFGRNSEHGAYLLETGADIAQDMIYEMNDQELMDSVGMGAIEAMYNAFLDFNDNKPANKIYMRRTSVREEHFIESHAGDEESNETIMSILLNKMSTNEGGMVFLYPLSGRAIIGGGGLTASGVGSGVIYKESMDHGIMPFVGERYELLLYSHGNNPRDFFEDILGVEK